MKNINIGFDLGVASVGWSVYDTDNEEIIDCGVKLFEQSKKAEDRRSARSLRRRYKRKEHRIERFDLLLKEKGISTENHPDNNLLQKRIEGLDQPLEMDDIVNILKFFLRYRGYNAVGDDTRENPYKKRYDMLLPCELQEIILEEEGHYRGLEFPFLIEDYREEIEEILNNQSKYHNEIDQGFIDKYFEIFNSRRKFWEGPGGKRADQLTPFGRYTNIDDLEKDDNETKYLFEKLIKDCSVYVGEKSAPVDNYYAQRFNFLNDMINLRFTIDSIKPEFEEKMVDVNGEYYKLSLEAINEIEHKMLSSKNIIPKKIFKEVTGADMEDISGYRINTKKEIEITKFGAYKKAINKLRDNDLDIDIINNKELWNKIAYILTVSPDGEKEAMLEQHCPELSEKGVRLFKGVATENSYHSFSEKALKKYIELMEEFLQNSSTIERQQKELIKSDVKQLKLDKYFNDAKSTKMTTKFIDELVASPQVKKSLRKAIITFNQIQKEYSPNKGYNLNYVVVESNKELLNDQGKKDYEQRMGENENLRKKALQEIGPKLNKKGANKEKLILKQMLLAEANYKCAYCDTVVNLENMEAEHILPLSKSADDSYSNKVCSCHDCNSRKDNKTPYQFLHEDEFEMFEKRMTKLFKNGNIEKLQKLLNKDDLNKYGKKFINRNLRDTAYVSKAFNEQLRLYKAAIEHRNGNDLEWQVITMPPAITAKVRSFDLQKDRENKYHHAVDATICAMYPTTPLGQYSNRVQNDNKIFWRENISIDLNKAVGSFTLTGKMLSQLKNIDYTNTRFHFEIKTNPNGQLANADINKVLIDNTKSEKEKYKKIEYIGNIYANDDAMLKNLKKMLTDDKSSKVLGIKYNDKPTFELLKKIFIEYSGRKYKKDDGKEVKVNPFVLYCCEQHEISPTDFDKNISKYGIRPESKKGKVRPVIKRLNYATKVTSPYILNKSSINTKDDSFIMLDSLKTAYTKIYRNVDKGNYIFLPIYSVYCDMETLEVQTDNKYYQETYKRLVGDQNVEFVMNVRTNDYLRCTKKDGKVIEGLYSGYHKKNGNLELKTGKGIVKSDKLIEKIAIYGLGITNVNLSEK